MPSLNFVAWRPRHAREPKLRGSRRGNIAIASRTSRRVAVHTMASPTSAKRQSMSGVIDSWCFSSSFINDDTHPSRPDRHIASSSTSLLHRLAWIIKYWSRNYRHYGPRGPGRGCCRMYASLVQIDSNALEMTVLLTFDPF
jgi:hypothetical protein